MWWEVYISNRIILSGEGSLIGLKLVYEPNFMLLQKGRKGLKVAKVYADVRKREVVFEVMIE